MRIYQDMRMLHTERLWFALNIILTLIYSINYHLLNNVSINTCILNRLWFALNIMITLSYICYSINNHLSKDVYIKTFFQPFYMYDFDIMNHGKYKCLLVNKVHFHCHCPSAAMGSLETCTHVFPMPKIT